MREIQLFLLEDGVTIGVGTSALSVLTGINHSTIGKYLKMSENCKAYRLRTECTPKRHIIPESDLEKILEYASNKIKPKKGSDSDVKFKKALNDFRHWKCDMKAWADSVGDLKLYSLIPSDIIELSDPQVLWKIWQSILENIENIPSRAILSTSATLISVCNDKKFAEIKISVERNAFPMVKKRQEHLGRAMAQFFKKPVRVYMADKGTIGEDLAYSTNNNNYYQDDKSLIQPSQGRSEIVFQKSKPILENSAPIQVDVDHSINENPLPYQNEVKIKPNSKGIPIAYLTIRGAARVLGIHKTSIERTFRSGGLEPKKLLEMLANAGFQGGGLQAFSTQGIPDIAFSEMVEYYALHAGRYCTESARKLMSFFKNCGVRQSLLNIAEFTPEQPAKPQTRSVTDPKLLENTIAISKLLAGVAIDGGLDPRLASKFVLGSVEYIHPELKGQIKALNAASPIPIEQPFLNPTELGKLVQPTMVPHAINILLTQQDYQSDRRDSEPRYIATEKGKPYSMLIMNQANNSSGNGHTYQQLRWSPEIIEFLDLRQLQQS